MPPVRQHRASTVCAHGSIPAHAGEPTPTRSESRRDIRAVPQRVYPRARGGAEVQFGVVHHAHAAWRVYPRARGGASYRLQVIAAHR